MRFSTATKSAICGALLAARSAVALQLNLQDDSSIKSAAKTVLDGMLTFYTGGVQGQIISQIPGVLPGPYYWWEAGAMFGSMIDYWYYTGDDEYNSIVTDAMLWQTGPDNNYMPPNQSKSLGNDDQGFWGMAAMSAAEAAFPNPPSDKPQWLALAQAVFNSQALRWDTSTCNGGMRWQIFTFNNGYNYKNSISNGCFFNLAARLGAYTHNSTYLDWARKDWDWITSVGLVAPAYQIYDGTSDVTNCTQLSKVQWSYNAGVFLYGAAMMYNQTTGAEQSEWEARINGILDAAAVFFTKENVMYEVACEPGGNCNTDQLSFKAYLSRWMAATTKVAGFTAAKIMPLLQSSASAAALSCSGNNDNVCGTKWTTGTWDGATGVGQQMSALEVIQSNLVANVAGPVSQGAGGLSKGDPNAGTGGDNLTPTEPTTAGDRAGAGILTALVLVMLVGGTWWLVK